MVNSEQLPGTTDRKGQVLGSRVTQPERRLIEAAAAVVPTTVSDFIRMAAVTAARATIAGEPGPGAFSD